MARAARRNPFAIRIPDELRPDLEARADRAGLSLGGFFLAAVQGPTAPAPRRVRHPSVDRAELARLMAALGKIGSNVNQLAHQANAGSWPDRQSLAQAVADVQWMRNAVMTALGIAPPAEPAAPGAASGGPRQ